MTAKKRRLYPFTEQVQGWPLNINNTSSNGYVITKTTATTYKPNPFHGIDRWLFALDEWHHRHCHHAVLVRAWRPYCDWWDRRLTGLHKVR